MILMAMTQYLMYEGGYVLSQTGIPGCFGLINVRDCFTMFGTLEYDFINVYRVIFVYDTYSRYN